MCQCSLAVFLSTVTGIFAALRRRAQKRSRVFLESPLVTKWSAKTTNFHLLNGLVLACASQVFVDDRLVGTMEHGKSPVLRIPACAPAASAKRSGDSNPRPCHQRGSAELLVLVHAMGRNSAGCDWDSKGLVGSRVLFEGAAVPCVLLGPEFRVVCTCWPQGSFEHTAQLRYPE